MKILATVGTGVGFMLVGFGLGYEFGFRRGFTHNVDEVVSLIDETDKLINALHEKGKDEVFQPQEPIVEIIPNESKKPEKPEKPEKRKSETEMLTEESRKEEDYTPYYKPSDIEESEKKWDKSEDFDKISVTFLEEDDEEDEYTPEEREELELLEAQEEAQDYFSEDADPYTIDPEVFRVNETGYEQDSWSYHNHDGYIVDFRNQILDEEDVQEYLGDTVKMLENAYDDSIIYVRSPRRQTEIELILDTRPFDEVYGGKRERLQRKAAKQRRLRQDDPEA